jgi:hypothetical protein
LGSSLLAGSVLFWIAALPCPVHAVGTFFLAQGCKLKSISKTPFGRSNMLILNGLSKAAKSALTRAQQRDAPRRSFPPQT